MRRFTIIALAAVLAASTFTACGDDSSSGSGPDAYCARIQAYKDKSDSLDVVFAGDELPDPAKLKDAFTTMQTMIHDLEKGAPSEIAADVAKQGAAIDSVVAIFDKYDWDLMALAASPDMAEMQTQMTGEEMTAASDRLEAYSTNTCGIESSS